MAEKCPLSGGRAPREIPPLCMRQCQGLIDLAIKNRSVEVPYQVHQQVLEASECQHKDTSLEFSWDSLESVGSAAVRFYVIVDECGGCGEEYGSTSYSFECPNN